VTPRCDQRRAEKGRNFIVDQSPYGCPRSSQGVFAEVEVDAKVKGQ